MTSTGAPRRILVADDHQVVRDGIRNALSEVLLDAIRQVLGGERYVSPALASRLADEITGNASAEPHRELSERELQVLRLLGEGHGVGEIAEKLSLIPKTISTYRSRLLDKMDMGSDAELIRYAIEWDLVQ